MFGKVCKHNKWLVEGFSLTFQIVFVFAFLTIFFFAYVIKIEKEEFENQMNYVVDQIFTKNIEKSLLGTTDLQKIVPIISGVIDGIEFKAQQDSASGVKSVEEKNKDIRVNAFKTLGYVLGGLIICSIVILIIGYCLPIPYQTKEALWVVFFVALTELTFLQVVAKNYISADPNKIKRVLGQTISNWVCANHPKDVATKCKK